MSCEESPLRTVVMADNAPSGLLEACLVVGASEERLKELCQLQGKELPTVEPEVLQVHAPPFVTRETPANAFDPAPAFSRVQKRRSFKKRDRPAPAAKPERSPDDLSVPQNIDLIAMQQLCFPDGLKLTRESREDLYHFLVFTDVFGNQTHGVVARFSRPVQRDNGLRAAKLFTTLAICIISKYPYYNALRDCLSCFLAQQKTTRISDFEEQVKEFSAKLVLVPIPPPGSLHVVFQLRPLLIQLSSRLDADRRVLDLDLHLPFLCFKPKQILQIIGGILMEQRLVFLSTDWSRLTLVAESFMSFIHPLRWQHPFVPVLSRQMLDFLMAPTAYLMGCHTFQFDEVTEEIEDLVLINIDHGTVTSSSLDALELPVVPAAAGDGFRLRCRALPLHFDLELCHAGTHIDINDLRGHRRRWQHRLNSLIISHSLELLLNIFSEVCDFLNYEHRVFNSEEFLRSRDAADLAFYTKVLDTHIFHSFLRDRLSQRSDAFTRLQQKLRSETRRLRTMTESPRRPTMEEMNRKFTRPESALTRRLGRSMPDLADHKLFASPGKTTTPLPSPWNPLRPITTFKLPEFPPPLAYHYVQNYYHELLAQLGRAISAAAPDDSALLARYHYLRGLVNWVAGHPADALADFQSLYKTDMDIFPAALVSTLLEALPAESRRASEGRGELKRLISLVKREKERVKPDTVTVKRFQLPSKHLPPDQFVRCVQESGMVKDAPTIRRLFQALTVGLQDSFQSVFYLDADGQQKQVDPDVFRFFYSFWKETEAAAQDLDLPPVVLEQLETDECVYKLSSSVKTSHGVGKIAMTQRRLFLLTEGRPGYMEITKFRHIQEVKLCSAPFLLLRIPSLKIRTSYRREWFEANLKSECDLWHLMIKEMWAGRKMADIHKDPQFLEQALTNALLMDAVVGSVPTQKATYAAAKLAYFDRMKSEGPVMTPSTTSETLKHKINPCLDLTAPQAVDVLLYTPGRLGAAEPGCSGTPKLWCGMSDGKVLVFDAASWSLQHCSVQLGAARMNCMLSVNEQQLWIGSQDSCIYIIHPHSVSCNKQLTEHHTEVTGLTLEQRDKYSQAVAYSCSAEGCVIMWDVYSLQVKRQFSVSCERLRSVQIHRGMLWFGAGDRVMEVRRNGSLHRDTGLVDHVASSPASISCFLVLDEQEQVWAGLADVGELWVWQRRDLNRLVLKIQLKDCNGVTCMIKVKNQVWVGGVGGGASGKVYVVSGSGVVEKELSAHGDCVQALCSAEDRYVLSGAASRDGKIAIWKVE